MKKISILILLLFKIISLYSQNTYDNIKTFYFDGIEYKTKVEVMDSLEEINIITFSKKKYNVVNTQKYKFEDIFVGTHIRLFNRWCN